MVKLYGVSIRAFLQQKIWFLSTGFKNLHAVQKFRHGKQTSMLRPTKKYESDHVKSAAALLVVVF